MKSKILAGLLSVTIAFVLWFYVINVVNPDYEETYYDVPVVLQNESILTERGLMIIGDAPTVTLRLKGNRSDLVGINNSNLSVMANVSGIAAPGEHLVSYTPSYPGNIPNNAISVQKHDPDLITLQVAKMLTKTVDVKLNYIGSVAEGFIADKENAVVDYTSIELSGPEEVVKRITQAVVDVNMDQKNETVVGEYVYALCDAQGEPVDAQYVTTNVEKLNLSVKVQRVKEITLKVDVIAGGGANDKNTIITMSTEKIQVTGSDAILEDLEELKVGTVELSEILEDRVLTFPIVLPTGIHNETGITEVEVGVKFENLTTKTLNLTEFKTVNIPSGMSVQLITQALEVVVRGPEKYVSTITAEDCTVTVDLSGAQPGSATIKAQIGTSSSYGEVGAVGAYSVSATVRKIG